MTISPIAVDSIRGDRLIHPPDTFMGGYNITGHRHQKTNAKGSKVQKMLDYPFT